STITLQYRVGGGRRGRIGVGQISTSRQISPQAPANAVTVVNFRNITPSTGGTDRESLADAKRRAPRDFAMQRSIVTDFDYAQAYNGFGLSVLGSVAKGVATIRTSINASRLDIYALAAGPDDTPVKHDAGLKAGLTTYVSDLNGRTDHVVIMDRELKPVTVER